MVGEVAAIYNSLSPEDRSQTGIWAGNYGEAAAIDFFGPQYGLPDCILAPPKPLVLGSAPAGL